MGLDNGVTLKTRRKLNFEEIPEGLEGRFSDAERDEKGFYSYGICYWRKWRPMRNYLIRVMTGDSEGNDYYELSSSDISNLIQYEFNCLLEPANWEQLGSIFEFSAMAGTIAIDIAVLSWVRNYLREHNNEGYLEFYDSY